MPAKKAIRWITVLKERFVETEVPATSVMIAYYLLLSLFPLLIAVGNILPYLGLSPQVVMPYVDIIVPQAVQPVLDPIITSLLTQSSGGLLSVSAVGLLWSASRGVHYLQRGMNKAYGVPTVGGFILKRSISVLMVFLVILLLVVFVVVFSVGQHILLLLADPFPFMATLNQYLSGLKWPSAIIFIFCLLLLTYRVLPDVKLRIRDVWAGTVFATTGVLLLTQLFTIYMQFVSRNISSYGALGTFFILMFWLNFICMIILLGAVLNAALKEVKQGKAQPQRSRLDDLLQRKTNAWMENYRTRAQAKMRAAEAKKTPTTTAEKTFADTPPQEEENSLQETDKMPADKPHANEDN